MRVLIATVLLFAAAAVAGADRGALVGTWHRESVRSSNQHIATTMTFKDDGTFSGFIDQNGKRAWNFAGKWVLSGNWLHYHYTESDLPELGPGTEDRDEIVNVTATELHVRSGDRTTVYARSE